MDIYERIQKEIIAECGRAGGQVAFAQKSGMTQPSISRYLNSTKSDIRGMKLETFFKLFPSADIVFHRPKGNAKEALLRFIDCMNDDQQGRLLNILPQIFPEIVVETKSEKYGSS